MATILPRRDLLLRLGKLGLACVAPAGVWAPRVASGFIGASDNSAEHVQAIPELTNLRTLSDSGQWETYSQEFEPQCNVFHAIEFTLTQNQIGPNANTIVAADTITIEGQIIAPGSNVTLIARQIIAHTGSLLDCSGENAIAIQFRADDGGTPGNKGQDGKSGDNGKPGGTISISAHQLIGKLSLKSNGGNGAKGQQGGDGAKGETGPKGTDSTVSSGPGPGGQGGKGGRAGSGGAGGDGKDAGMIIVRWVNGPSPVALAIGGVEGKVGNPGKVGEFGDGGPPGDRCVTYETSCGSSRNGGGWDCTKTKCYGDHVPGPKGLYGDEAEQKYVDGKKGKDTTPSLIQGSINDLAPDVSINLMHMVLSQCELDFVNLDKSVLDARLKWIAAVCKAPNCGERFEIERSTRFGAKLPRTEQEEWTALGSKATVLHERLALGLDAYGYMSNYVSPLNPVFLEEQVEKTVRIAEIIETAHDKYLAAANDIKVKREQLDTVLANVTGRLGGLESTLSQESQNRINALQDELAKLSQNIAQLTDQVLQADKAFKAEVARNSPGCDVIGLLKFVGAAVAIAYGVSAGYSAMAASITTINAETQDRDFIEAMVFVGETFDKNKVGQHLDKIVKGYEQLEKLKEARDKNNAKIAISLDAFEAQLKPYLKLTSAQKYLALIRTLVDVSQARNHKQLLYTQLVLDQQNAKAQKDLTVNETKRVRTLLTLTNNPALKECLFYLSKSLRQAKRDILALMELQRRSLIYTILKEVRPYYQWEKVAELRATQLSYNRIWIEGEKERDGEAQTLPAVFRLTQKTDGHFFKQLTSKGWAAFAIPADHPDFNAGSTALVTVQEVKITMNGLKSSRSTIACRLTHSGLSVIKDYAGQTWNFVHNSRPTILKFEFKSGQWNHGPTDGNLRGSDDKYNYYSPLTTWVLSFYKGDKIDISGIDFSNVKTVQLEFKIRALPRNSQPMKTLYNEINAI